MYSAINISVKGHPPRKNTNKSQSILLKPQLTQDILLFIASLELSSGLDTYYIIKE